MMDYNDYSLALRDKAIRKADEEASHIHVVEGYVVCRYPVTVEYDDREYGENDIEELMVDKASKEYYGNIYYDYDDIEIV